MSAIPHHPSCSCGDCVLAYLNSCKDCSGNRYLTLHHPTMLQGWNAYVGGETRHSADDSSDSSPDTGAMKQVKYVHEDRTGLGRARNRNSIGSILSSYDKSTASKLQDPPAEINPGLNSEHAITTVHHAPRDEVIIPQTSTDDNTVRFSPTEPTVKVSNLETPTHDQSGGADYRQKVEHISDLLRRLENLQRKMDDVLSQYSSRSSTYSSSSSGSRSSSYEAADCKKTGEDEATSNSDTPCLDATEKVEKNEAQTCGRVEVTEFEKAIDGDTISETVLSVTLCCMLGMVLMVGASTA
jgi:hypothetical protein